MRIWHTADRLSGSRNGDDGERRTTVTACDCTPEIVDDGRRLPPEHARQEMEQIDAMRRHMVVPRRGPLVGLRSQVVLARVDLRDDSCPRPPGVGDTEEGAVG